MELLIMGDLVPTESNFELFNNADIDTLIGKELKDILKNADIRIFNLETPISNVNSPIEKFGDTIIAPEKTINGIKALNPSLVTLANNHIMDHGEVGLKNTKKTLDTNNIPYVGVGNNVNEASKPYIFELNNIKIGIYACTEKEFTIATKYKSGANPFDPLESLEHINNLKKKCDYVIVLYHGGKEHYRYPSPYLKKVCNKMCFSGADLVVCQHSHCIGSYEKYNKSTIIYGQGNFLFDGSNNEYWDTSLIIKINIDDNKLLLDYIPIIKKNNKIRLASYEEKINILNDFKYRSEEILNENVIEEKYNEFAKNMINEYLVTFSGVGKWQRRLDKYIFKGYLLNKRYNKDKLLRI